jgi:hypothetical protein
MVGLLAFWQTVSQLASLNAMHALALNPAGHVISLHGAHPSPSAW